MDVGPIELAVGALGVALLGAAVLNRAPLGVLRSTASGGAPSDAAPIDSGQRDTAGGLSVSPDAAADTAGGAPSVGAAGLVSYTNPRTPAAGDWSGQTYKVAPAALAGLQAWARALGVPGIIITIGYRSPERQAEGHRKDPNQFAAPGSSLHEKGIAVDVHLDAMRKAYGKDTAAVQAAGKLAGWYFVGRSGPMHASYGKAG